MKSSAPAPASNDSSITAGFLGRVCLLHNYRESGQMSMKLYAERLGDALLAKGVVLDRVRPRNLLPSRIRQAVLLDKLDSYAGRFALYPLIVRRRRADIFHIVDHGQAFLLRYLDASKTVVTCHDIILLVLASGRLGSAFSPPFATSVLRRSLEWMKKTRWIIADSHQTKNDLVTVVGIDPANIRVIYPGLNYPYRPDAEVRAGIRSRLGLSGGMLVLQVGQAGFYKNLPGCLRVVAKLRKGGLQVTFVRAGQRLRPEHLALLDRLGLRDSVADLGPMTDRDLAGLYAAADVLLFPSLYEGFGWPPVEAMASGLPVVCSRSGSLGEIVGDAALTAEPEDIDGLANQVAAVLTDPALAQSLRLRGLERARLFDWERSASQVLDVYRQVIK